ncbi:MAG TPA: efflux transporter outer membrane subunit [Alphaproteobacteria bacterium]|nr:efflux transporter outer membrane subunit [Alphaproteobacteria bacterium]
MTRASEALAATLLALGLLAGCEVGPDFLRPAAPPVTSYTPEPLATKTAAADVPAGQAQRFTDGLDIPGEWWTLFHSAPLDQLIAEALKANPSLAAAQAALREARENVYAEEGALFPSVTANGSATREKVSGASFGNPGLSSTLGVTTASLNVSYALDVFGGVRRQIESLEAEEEFQRFQLEAAYLSLTSNVVVAAVGEASLRAQVAATEDIIQIETQELGVLQKQLELGGASKAAVLAQQATLSQAQATLPPLQRQLAQTRNQLAALAGHYPSEVPAGKFELATMHLPDDLPLSLPSKLVEQRPDVRAAEAELHAASANIGVATANQLPQFNITGQLGTSSLGFAQLFSPGTGIWSIGGSVAQTVFDAGTLLHKKRAAVAAYEQAAASYRNTVLTAFQNVADALRALQSDADAVKAQAEAVHSAADSLAISRDQYQAGAITYTALLAAEQTYQQARIALVQAQANRFADTAALFQALGGGWWNRSDIAANKAGEPERFWLPPLPPAKN